MSSIVIIFQEKIIWNIAEKCIKKMRRSVVQCVCKGANIVSRDDIIKISPIFFVQDMSFNDRFVFLLF